MSDFRRLQGFGSLCNENESMKNFNAAKLEVIAPQDHALDLRDEPAKISPGVIGNHDQCMPIFPGSGSFHLLAGSNPFEGWKVRGRVRKVVLRGTVAFENGRIMVETGYRRNVRA